MGVEVNVLDLLSAVDWAVVAVDWAVDILLKTVEDDVPPTLLVSLAIFSLVLSAVKVQSLDVYEPVILVIVQI